MEITELLNAAKGGDRVAADRLYRAIYDELRRIAEIERQQWMGQETLNATALVHEAFLKLAGPREEAWRNRGHFFAVASRAMRHVLVDYAERQRAAKRGGGLTAVPLREEAAAAPDLSEDILTLHEALLRLEDHAPRRARVVECRFLAGLPVRDTAEALQISPATVKREWALARLWLYEEIRGAAPE